MSKLQSIQVLRGVAALSVVAFHGFTLEQKYAGGDALLPRLFQLGELGVDLFFVISGFVMATVTRGRFARKTETLRFLFGRLSRIYPTYWCYLLLTVAVFMLKPEWVNASQPLHASFISSFFLLPDNYLPMLMVAWSLVHEVWFYVVFAMLLQLKERYLFPALLLWGGVVIGANVFWVPAQYMGAKGIMHHPFSLEFIAGALAALGYFKVAKHERPSGYLAPLSLAILLAGLGVAHVLELRLERGLLRPLFLGILFGFLVFALALMERWHKLEFHGALTALGDMSYTVYLSHILVLSAVGRIWQFMGTNPASLADNGIAIVGMFLAVLVYGWIGYRVIERPALMASHRLRNRWFGH